MTTLFRKGSLFFGPIPYSAIFTYQLPVASSKAMQAQDHISAGGP